MFAVSSRQSSGRARTLGQWYFCKKGGIGWLNEPKFSGPIIHFNPWVGCEKVNEGCKFCYAEQLMDHRYGRVQWGPTGTRSRTKTWGQPLKWDRDAAAAGEKHKVFCASLADVFEDRNELVPWRNELFSLIDRTPNLYWLLLTKRPENIGWMWPYDAMPRQNVWLGTSIANQKNADEFILRLNSARLLSPVLFLSLEPQIGPVTLFEHLHFPAMLNRGHRRLDWVITGGESKQGPDEPRPFNLGWARLTRNECHAAGVPWFFKQCGSRVQETLDTTYSIDLRDSHGGDINEWPSDLRVRECPETYGVPRLAQGA